LQKSTFDVFSVLATLPRPSSPAYRQFPGIEQTGLLLNIVEMWCCLLLRSLPLPTLEIWLPPNTKLQHPGDPRPLNIANPLDQGGKGARSWVNLSGSQDPLVQEYIKVEDQSKIKAEQAVKATNRDENRISFLVSFQPSTLLLVGSVVVAGYMMLKSRSLFTQRPSFR